MARSWRGANHQEAAHTRVYGTSKESLSRNFAVLHGTLDVDHRSVAHAGATEPKRRASQPARCPIFNRYATRRSLGQAGRTPLCASGKARNNNASRPANFSSTSNPKRNNAGNPGDHICHVQMRQPSERLRAPVQAMPTHGSSTPTWRSDRLCPMISPSTRIAGQRGELSGSSMS